MKALPRDPDRLYTEVIEPLFEPLNAKRVDFATLRACLPAADRKTTRRAALVVDAASALAHRGTIEIRGGVTFEKGGIMIVLGDCRIEGGVFSPPHAYSALVVGGRLVVDRIHTSGDVIAFGGIEGDVVYGSDNDHSTYAPSLAANVLIAAWDRSTIVPKIQAREKICGFDVDARIAKRFPISTRPTRSRSARSAA